MFSTGAASAMGAPSRNPGRGGAGSAPTRPAEVALAKQPDWMPRMWHGCDIPTWFALLVRNRFAAHPRHWCIAAMVTVVALVNTLLGLVERAFHGHAVRSTIVAPPIFLIGHWRSGTTLLHELMICNDRFGFPTTYQCIEPHHFLLTERVLSGWLGLLLPATRPMDNMPTAFDRPQEDEFALCMLGAGSPYSAMAFPNRPGGDDFLDLERDAPAALRRWKQTFYGFLQRVTYKCGKRLVLKSPPHTARIKILNEMFPDALFINIVRNPFEVFPSTVNLWRTLHRIHGLQTPSQDPREQDRLEESVLRTYARMHEKLEEGRQVLRPDQFYELTYERLVRDPVGEIEKIYRYFGLPGFAESLPRLEAYVAGIGRYETNTYHVSAEQRARVAQRWRDAIRRYGYGDPPAVAA
jgi:omega-hydroxy-beta-dihydromenaquinone-9 sulfotransferase